MVVGIFEGTPANSSIQFDMVFSFDAFKEIMTITGTLSAQNSYGLFHTYLILKKGTDLSLFDAKLSTFINSYGSGPARHLFLKRYIG
ncbi:hypothetical protein ACDQ55_14585 [Chitinophaga sp. 30R24]|uniref:hypothetical protein n=1 Tax=Chitinophaga sp. 30R24 TaxID=3248838 RepID=UPI003B921D6B